MSDQKIKDLIGKDLSTPSAGLNEWSEIQSKIEGGCPVFPPTHWYLKLFLVGASTVAMGVLVTVFSISSVKTKEANEITNYLVESDYFSQQEDDLYSWIEQ